MTWRVTEHAAMRYCARVDRVVSTQRARELLSQAAPTAQRLNEDTGDGASQYLCAGIRCVGVVREPHDSGEGRVVVTVVPIEHSTPATLEAAFTGYTSARPLLPYLPEDEPAWSVLRREFRTLLGDYLVRSAPLRLPRDRRDA